MMEKAKLVIFLIIISCVINQLHGRENPKAFDCKEYLFHKMSAFKKQIATELNFDLGGGHGETVHEKIEDIELTFYASRRASLEEARALHLFLVKKVAQLINDDPKLQPYLAEQPFNFKRISVTIIFSGPFGCYYDGSVYHVFNVNDLARNEKRNTIGYRSSDPFTGKLIEIVREPYEEAMRKAKDIPQEELKVHKETNQERITDQIFENLALDWYKKDTLYTKSIGCDLADKIEAIGARFIFFHPVSLEVARRLELLVVKKLLTAINQNEELRPYLKEYPFTPDRLKIYMEFKTKERHSYCNGSMNHVVLENNQLSYFRYTDPKHYEWEEGKTLDPPELIAKETYQEALERYRVSASQNGSWWSKQKAKHPWSNLPS